MKRWYAFIPVLLLAIHVSHCGRPRLDSDDSTVKWGMYHDRRAVNMAGLLSLQPNSKICVRGYVAKEAAAAIRKWTDAIGRTSRLPVQVDCTDGQRQITLSGPQDSGCSGRMAGYTNTVDQIHVCANYSGNDLFHVLMHESGHMFGLCDQYSGGSDCTGGQVNPDTVMGAVPLGRGKTALTADDVAGIKAITSIPELGANRAWLALGPAPDSAGTPPTQPQVPTADTTAVKPVPVGNSVVQSGSQQRPTISPIARLLCENFSQRGTFKCEFQETSQGTQIVIKPK